MDTLTKKQRSALMSRIRSVSMMEVRARKLATLRAGVRLYHQPKNLVGRPDYANKAKKVAVYIHGCFWHMCSKHCKMPKSNKAFWSKKLNRNVARNIEMRGKLRKLGYEVIILWEHSVNRKSAR